jgi:hypothetical protein
MAKPTTPEPVVMYRGDTWKRQWVLKDRFKRPVDITGCSAKLHVRDSNQVKVLDVGTATTEITVDGLNGQLTMVASTSGVAVGVYTYDLEITFLDGSILTVDANTLTLLQDATHD